MTIINVVPINGMKIQTISDEMYWEIYIVLIW